MTRDQQHHTHVEKRGPYFIARCSCGYQSTHLDTKAEAENWANDHVVAAVKGER